MTLRRRLFGPVLFVAYLLYLLNPELGAWADPFAPSVPVEQWFQHRLQWDPIIGCGTEMCR